MIQFETVPALAIEVRRFAPMIDELEEEVLEVLGNEYMDREETMRRIFEVGFRSCNIMRSLLTAQSRSSCQQEYEKPIDDALKHWMALDMLIGNLKHRLECLMKEAMSLT